VSARPVTPAPAVPDAVRQAARQIAASMPGRNEFNFSYDQSTGMTIVRVYNADTGELVRQIPSEEIVRIAQLMRQEEARPGVVDLTA
jgi:flagellar protein FlaG